MPSPLLRPYYFVLRTTAWAADRVLQWSAAQAVRVRAVEAAPARRGLERLLTALASTAHSARLLPRVDLVGSRVSCEAALGCAHGAAGTTRPPGVDLARP